MYKLGFKILCWLLGLLLLIGIGFYLYNRFFKQDEKPQATISNYELLRTINERLRLVSEEVTLKRDINIRQGNYSAEGLAQLTAYIKYDLEKLEIDRPSADTCYIYLPEPDIEIGRTPGKSQSVKYYEYHRGLFGLSRQDTYDRNAIHLLDETILEEAEDAVQDDAEIIQKAQAKAKQQIEQLVSKLYPDLHIFIQEGVPYGKKSNSEISYK